MSRSYRKFPVVRDEGPRYRKFQKTKANRKVRRTEDIPCGKAYRKRYDSWNICDIRYFEPFSRWMRTKEKYHLEYWNGGGYGSYFRPCPKNQEEYDRREFEEYGSAPDFKKELKEWRKMYYWK